MNHTASHQNKATDSKSGVWSSPATALNTDRWVFRCSLSAVIHCRQMNLHTVSCSLKAKKLIPGLMLEYKTCSIKLDLYQCLCGFGGCISGCIQALQSAASCSIPLLRIQMGNAVFLFGLSPGKKIQLSQLFVNVERVLQTEACFFGGLLARIIQKRQILSTI